jgi:hypothetical protein
MLFGRRKPREYALAEHRAVIQKWVHKPAVVI